MTWPSVLFFLALLTRTPAITAPASRSTTTTPMMALVRSGPALLRAPDTALLREASACCWRFLRALRSAPPTDQPLLTFAEQPVQRQRGPRPDHEPCRQQQEPDVPRDLLRVIGLPRRDLAATAEAAAGDGQPASPGLGHRADEREQHQGREHRGQPGAEPDQEQHAERELQE